MNKSDRTKLCKLQQSGGKSLYILYSSEIKPFSQIQTVHGPKYPHRSLLHTPSRTKKLTKKLPSRR